MRETQPDIKVPRHDRTALENLIKREYRRWASLELAIEMGGAEERGAKDPIAMQAEMAQCYANFNHLLDFYPSGLRRNDTNPEVIALESLYRKQQ